MEPKIFNVKQQEVVVCMLCIVIPETYDKICPYALKVGFHSKCTYVLTDSPGLPAAAEHATAAAAVDIGKFR